MFKEKIRESLYNALQKLGASDTREDEIRVDFAPEHTSADYATNIAFSLATKLKKTPFETAQIIANELQNDEQLKQIVSRIEAVTPAFINFFLSQDAMMKEVQCIANNYPFSPTREQKKRTRYLIEFAHPNTHKPFHIGHLRNIIIGEAISRLLESQGNEVIRVNYQGDVGLHIAKVMWGIKKLGFSDPKDIEKRANFLGKAYVEGNLANEEELKEVREINKKLYDKSDSELNGLYQQTRRWSLDYFDAIYKRVGTTFKRFYFESETADEGKKIAEEALKKGILVKSKGAVIYPGEKDGLHSRVFLTSEGLPTYEAKDLGLAKLQSDEFNPDKIIHIVGADQKGYFEVLFKVLEKLNPDLGKKEVHLSYGLVSSNLGKMSSRKGNVIAGKALLDGAKKTIIDQYKTPEDVAEQIAVGAVKYSFLRVAALQDIVFDRGKATSLQEDSGPYLQYTYARTQSVFEKALLRPSATDGQAGEGRNIQDSFVLNKEELSVIKSVARFSDIVRSAANEYAPHILCEYIFSLAQTYNNFYSKHKIIESANKSVRLLITRAVGNSIKNGLTMLGIEAPKRM